MRVFWADIDGNGAGRSRRSLIHQIARYGGRCFRSSSLRKGLLPLGIVFAACGCVPVKIHQQRLVSQPNMTFSQSPVWTDVPRQATQIETGRSFAGGGQGAGCTSCK